MIFAAAVALSLTIFNLVDGDGPPAPSAATPSATATIQPLGGADLVDPGSFDRPVQPCHQLIAGTLGGGGADNSNQQAGPDSAKSRPPQRGDSPCDDSMIR